MSNEQEKINTAQGRDVSDNEPIDVDYEVTLSDFDNNHSVVVFDLLESEHNKIMDFIKGETITMEDANKEYDTAKTICLYDEDDFFDNGEVDAMYDYNHVVLEANKIIKDGAVLSGTLDICKSDDCIFYDLDHLVQKLVYGTRLKIFVYEDEVVVIDRDYTGSTSYEFKLTPNKGETND